MQINWIVFLFALLKPDTDIKYKNNYEYGPRAKSRYRSLSRENDTRSYSYDLNRRRIKMSDATAYESRSRSRSRSLSPYSGKTTTDKEVRRFNPNRLEYPKSSNGFKHYNEYADEEKPSNYDKYDRSGEFKYAHKSRDKDLDYKANSTFYLGKKYSDTVVDYGRFSEKNVASAYKTSKKCDSYYPTRKMASHSPDTDFFHNHRHNHHKKPLTTSKLAVIHLADSLNNSFESTTTPRLSKIRTLSIDVASSLSSNKSSLSNRSISPSS